MPKKISIVVGNLIFKTQKEATKFFKDMLNRYRDNETVNNEDYEILLNLIERHPEAEQKIGCGIKRFYRAQTDMPTSCFWLEREDGTCTDFSYGSCVRAKGKTLFQEFMEACRDAVKDDLIETKNTYFSDNADKEGKVECAITGEKITEEESHLDHMKPLTFQVIVTTFIKANNIIIDRNMLSDSHDGQFQTTFVNQEIKERFRNYHNGVAVLRVIRKGVNLQLGPSERIRNPKIPVLIIEANK